MPLTPDQTESAIKMFAGQRAYCASAGVRTYVTILDGLIDETRSGGPICDVLTRWDGAPESAFSLRVLGALHRLALDGKAPALAALFPTAGGTAAPDAVWPVARKVLADHLDYVIGYCARPPQTNEVGRSGVLLGGFLTIAQQFDKPLRLLEIGASAGLNLMWDKYRVVTDAFTWGEPSAALELRPKWDGPVPPLSPKITVASRAACDKNPIDIRTADDRARLESYIWPDQVHRLQRLRMACNTALRTPFRLDRADAADWLAQELRDLPKSETTVVYYSIFRQYVSPTTEAALEAVMAEAGARATADAPLAHLSMEMPNMKSFPVLTLTTWPGGSPKILATAHHHGEWVKWR